MKLGHNYYVYIVECHDGFYYTGVTNDLERRIYEHNEGTNVQCFTYKRRPVILRYQEHFTNILHAIEWEKQIKGWSRRKKQELIKGNFEEIRNLVSRNSKSSEGKDPSPGSG